MRADAMDALRGEMSRKTSVKGRVNNYELFLYYCGIDAYRNLELAYALWSRRSESTGLTGFPKTGGLAE